MLSSGRLGRLCSAQTATSTPADSSVEVLVRTDRRCRGRRGGKVAENRSGLSTVLANKPQRLRGKSVKKASAISLLVTAARLRSRKLRKQRRLSAPSQEKRIHIPKRTEH
ncbi:hypothetical protein SRHO_G00300900 [Serrasalmus rhombeus]